MTEDSKSTHRCEIVPVTLSPHGNADSLSVVKIGGYQAVVRTDDWLGRESGAYVLPDSIVDTGRPEFAFLAKGEPGKVRIKARKLRGEWSMGLLVPAPEGSTIGDDVAPLLGVEHYEPPEPISSGGEAESPPVAFRRLDGTVVQFLTPLPKYDVEAFRKYGADVFLPGEPVMVTEKIHGANARFMFDGSRFWCGSRTEWKREDPANLWWKALAGSPSLQIALQEKPGIVIYGEVFGQVQDLKYGTGPGGIRFAVFDVLENGKWLDALDARHSFPFLPWVPLIHEALPFDFDRLLQLAEGPSLVEGANHVREGVVVKPATERWHPSCGRVSLKIVGNGYLERS